jgi:hypothetical protein
MTVKASAHTGSSRNSSVGWKDPTEGECRWRRSSRTTSVLPSRSPTEVSPGQQEPAVTGQCERALLARWSAVSEGVLSPLLTER